MKKKVGLIVIIIILLSPTIINQSVGKSNPGQIYEGKQDLFYRNVTVYAPAVGTTEDGYVGVISTITVTIQNGSGRVFVDTLPLTQVDMQGSARLAVKVASSLVEKDNISTDEYDFFFVVRTNAPIIGGPSAGAVLTVATVAVLENWDINNETVMTGMINPDGSIGPIGGIPQKIDAAYSVGAKRFLIPKGQDTYTEYETTVENGWVVRNPITRSVSEYAMDNYGIEVIEVEDINEAIHNFTGHVFPRADPDENITIEGYVNAMKPLAENLLGRANNLYQDAYDLFVNTSIPNYYFADYESDLEDVLDEAEDRIDESQRLFDKKMYYTSTTLSFQSLMDSRFVYYASKYFNISQEDRLSYINELLDEITDFYEEQSEKARNAEINSVISLQCVGGAQKRVSQSDKRLDEANDAINDGSYVTGLYYLAASKERSESVGWWLNISESFNKSVSINVSELDNIAQEYIEDARQSIIYSTIIIQEVGQSSDYLTSAEEWVESAEEDMKKNYPAAALFEALEALVKANLAIENIDNDAESKIELAKNKAGSSITESKNQGVKPLLPVCYYEYANYLENDSAFDSALFYYKYSGIIAGALGFTGVSQKDSSSRYIGVPDIKGPNSMNWFLDNIWLIFSIGILGTILGIGIGLIVAGLSTGRYDKGKTQKGKKVEVKQSSIPKNQYFKDEDMPRSIKDYYKNQR